MPLIRVYFDSNARNYAAWLNGVPEKIQHRLEDKTPKLKRNTKKVVQNHLVPGKGVDDGIYRKSFTINDYSQSKWEISFQVFAKKPHYRLTHLLEDGHKVVVFKWGRGSPTKWGNIGMNYIHKRTMNIPHIEPGQLYAEKNFPILYDEGVNYVLQEGMKRLK